MTYKSKKDRDRLLGMSHGTANYRLSKDILFMFLKERGDLCFHCGKPMTRENFSIEHKEPWRSAENPKQTFFDLGNIAFSHQRCNSKAGNLNFVKKGHGTVACYLRGCRCASCKSAKAVYRKKRYEQKGRGA